MGRERGCKFEVRVKVAGKFGRKEGRMSGCAFSAWRWRKEEEEEEEEEKEEKEAESGDFGRRRGREDRQDRLEGVEYERRGRGLLDIFSRPASDVRGRKEEDLSGYIWIGHETPSLLYLMIANFKQASTVTKGMIIIIIIIVIIIIIIIIIVIIIIIIIILVIASIVPLYYVHVSSIRQSQGGEGGGE